MKKNYNVLNLKEVFQYTMQDNRRSAFTLAEVLITLGIIGVVAAMTLPALINNHRDKELITRVKKTYSALNQALELAQAHYATPGDNSALFSSGKTSAELTKEMSGYFNGARYCEAGANAEGCKNLNYKIKYASLMQSGNSGALITNMTGYPRIVLNDGSIIAMDNKGNSCDEVVETGTSFNPDGSVQTNPDGSIKTWTRTRAVCGKILFDVNGNKNPNQFGRDAYAVDIYRNKIGDVTWSAWGTESLHNILMGKKNPFVYKDYDANGEFEW